MRFVGVDIVLDRFLGHEELRHAVAVALGVGVERVGVVDDVSEYPDRPDADLVCVVSEVEGEFRRVVSIQCEPRDVVGVELNDVIGRVVRELEARALVPVEGPDPYVMWLVSPDEPARVVSNETMPPGLPVYGVNG